MPSAIVSSSSTMRTLVTRYSTVVARNDYDALRAGFTAAVSHELRTPLARLQTLLESAVLRGVVAERAERAELAGLRLDLRIEDEQLRVPLRARMLRLVTENLLENAIRYAGEGATCVVSLTREDGTLV